VHPLPRRVTRLIGPDDGITRFAIANGISAIGDALVAVSLAGSLFFSVSPDASRRQILLYLVITMVPFALLAPLIGPAIDRFGRGHRWIAALFFSVRAVAALVLAAALFDLAFYPVALLLLVMSKASGIVKQAIVPGLVVDPSQLVSANSTLARITTITGGIGAAIGGILLVIGSAVAPLNAACVAFVAASIAMTKVPPLRQPPRTARVELEYRELHTPAIMATSNAFAAIRGAVGFFVFGLAFALRRASEPAWVYAAAAIGFGVGNFAGNVIAPILRRRLSEVRLMAASLIVLVVSAAFGALGPSRLSAITVSVILGLSASVGRQAFDALMQRRAPLAMRGRAFARFETLFQLCWVAGAALATGLAVSLRVSMAAVVAVLAPVLGFYLRAALDDERFGGEHEPDPFTIARRHVTSAAEWLASDLPGYAAVEFASGVDVLRLAGVDLTPDIVDTAARLRDEALGDFDTAPDPGAVGGAIDRLEMLLATRR
jgi:predicted MFS family arabinose efflux permease